MPLSRRIPKLRGFTNPNKAVYAVINVGDLVGFGAGGSVNPDVLHERGLVKHRGFIKVLAEGEIDKALSVKAHAYSAAARAKIEAAGGTAEVIAK